MGIGSRVRSNIRVLAETARLSRVPRQKGDPRHLAALSPDDLGRFMMDQHITRAWESDRPILEELELPEMTGGVNTGDQRALYHLVSALKPVSVLEIGTHIGCSTVHIALALASAHTGAGATPKLTTVDIRNVNDELTKPWEDFDSKASPASLVKAVGCESMVQFATADSLGFLAEGTEMFDLIFLDGLHTAARVYQEALLAFRRLTPGGSIVLHDFYPDGRALWSDGEVIPGPYLAMRRLLRQTPGAQVLPLGDLPWPTKLNSNTTSLAVLTRI